jgi:hypothetical protein
MLRLARDDRLAQTSRRIGFPESVQAARQILGLDRKPAGASTTRPAQMEMM